jgi:hypothetical protein
MCAGEKYNQYLAEAEQLYLWPSNTMLLGTFTFTYSTEFVAIVVGVIIGESIYTSFLDLNLDAD